MNIIIFVSILSFCINFANNQNISIFLLDNSSTTIDLFESRLPNLAIISPIPPFPNLNLSISNPFNKSTLFNSSFNGQIKDTYIFQHKPNTIQNQTQIDSVLISILVSNSSLINVGIENTNSKDTYQRILFQDVVDLKQQFNVSECRFATSNSIYYRRFFVACNNNAQNKPISIIKFTINQQTQRISNVLQFPLSNSTPQYVLNVIGNCTDLQFIDLSTNETANQNSINSTVAFFCPYTAIAMPDFINRLYLFNHTESPLQKYFTFLKVISNDYDSSFPINFIQQIIPLRNSFQGFMFIDYYSGAFVGTYNSYLQTFGQFIWNTFSETIYTPQGNDPINIILAAVNQDTSPDYTMIDSIFTKNITVLSNGTSLWVYCLSPTFQKFYFQQSIALRINLNISSLVSTQESIITDQVNVTSNTIIRSYYKLHKQDIVEQFELLYEEAIDLAADSQIAFYSIPQVQQYGLYQTISSYNFVEISVRDSHLLITTYQPQKYELNITTGQTFPLQNYQIQYSSSNTNTNNMNLLNITIYNSQMNCFQSSSSSSLMTFKLMEGVSFDVAKIIDQIIICPNKTVLYSLSFQPASLNKNYNISIENSFKEILFSSDSISKFYDFTLYLTSNNFTNWHFVLESRSRIETASATQLFGDKFLLFAQKHITQQTNQNDDNNIIQPLTSYTGIFTFQCYHSLILNDFWCDQSSAIQIDAKSITAQIASVSFKSQIEQQSLQLGLQQFSSKYIVIYNDFYANSSFFIEYTTPRDPNLSQFRLSGKFFEGLILQEQHIKFFTNNEVAIQDVAILLFNQNLCYLQNGIITEFDVEPSVSVKKIAAFDSILSNELYRSSKFIEARDQVFSFGDEFLIIALMWTQANSNSELQESHIVIGTFIFQQGIMQTSMKWFYNNSIQTQCLFSNSTTELKIISPNRFIVIDYACGIVQEYSFDLQFYPRYPNLINQESPSLQISFIQQFQNDWGLMNLKMSNITRIVVSKYYVYVPLVEQNPSQEPNEQYIYVYQISATSPNVNNHLSYSGHWNCGVGNQIPMQVLSMSKHQHDIFIYQYMQVVVPVNNYSIMHVQDQINAIIYNSTSNNNNNQQLKMQIQLNSISFDVEIELLSQKFNTTIQSGQMGGVLPEINIIIPISELNKTQICNNNSQIFPVCLYEYEYILSEDQTAAMLNVSGNILISQFKQNSGSFSFRIPSNANTTMYQLNNILKVCDWDIILPNFQFQQYEILQRFDYVYDYFQEFWLGYTSNEIQWKAYQGSSLSRASADSDNITILSPTSQSGYNYIPTSSFQLQQLCSEMPFADSMCFFAISMQTKNQLQPKQTAVRSQNGAILSFNVDIWDSYNKQFDNYEVQMPYYENDIKNKGLRILGAGEYLLVLESIPFQQLLLYSLNDSSIGQLSYISIIQSQVTAFDTWYNQSQNSVILVYSVVDTLTQNITIEIVKVVQNQIVQNISIDSDLTFYNISEIQIIQNKTSNNNNVVTFIINLDQSHAFEYDCDVVASSLKLKTVYINSPQCTSYPISHVNWNTIQTTSEYLFKRCLFENLNKETILVYSRARQQLSTDIVIQQVPVGHTDLFNIFNRNSRGMVGQWQPMYRIHGFAANSQFLVLDYAEEIFVYQIIDVTQINIATQQSLNYSLFFSTQHIDIAIQQDPSLTNLTFIDDFVFSNAQQSIRMPISLTVLLPQKSNYSDLSLAWYYILLICLACLIMVFGLFKLYSVRKRAKQYKMRQENIIKGNIQQDKKYLLKNQNINLSEIDQDY